MQETWKPISGYPYEVSDQGRIRRGDRILKGTTHNAGYPMIALWVGGIGKQFLTHRLVLEAFVGPCPEGMECRHLNGDPSDSRLCNLAWGTHQQNIADKKTHGTFLPPPIGARRKLSWDILHAMRSETGLTQRQLAAKYGLAQSSVWYWLQKETLCPH